MKHKPLTAEFIADLYEAALDPSGLQGIPALASEFTGVESAGIWIVKNGRVAEIALTQDAVEAQKPYIAHFHKLDVWQMGIMRNLGQVVVGSESMPESELVKTEFYNDFARHYGIFRPIGVMMPIGDETLVSFGLTQPKTKHLLDIEDKPMMQEFLPHLKRALQLRQRHQLGSGRQQTFALDSLAFGALICTSSGNVLHSNHAAETIARARDGIILRARGKSVSAIVAAESARLSHLIHQAATAGGGGAITLTGKAGTPALIVLVTPLPNGTKPGLDASGHALLSIRPVDAPPAFDASRLSALFRLSPAQASLAVALYEGKSFADIADERGVKTSTLRTHFNEVLTRTGAKGLRDLVRLLGTIPPIR